ncbi:MAG: hypothetical protein N5P05_000063 [Chroococcopsis gigantea SAG 12.99]|jgi:uncharacterized protein YggE|nr:SIMPL domain-containing protein [Chlorogloea purpurea SAG 13.99]MDV2998457.1 hypothetical protein [Chroococcopsis gigantea SAG 12.99]
MKLKPLAIGLLAATVFFTSPSLPSMAQERLTRVITVTGEGTENIPTTLTKVQLGVEVQGSNAEAVQKEVATRSNGVVNFLRGRNVEKLETTGIQLQPVYDYSQNQRRLTGYVGSNIVSFQIKTEAIGNLLDESVKAGATRIDNVSFLAADEAVNGARQQALVEATQDAQKQADTVLKALGLTRKEIVTITINGGNTPVPAPRAMAMKAADSAPSPVIGGEQSVSASVTLQISY